MAECKNHLLFNARIWACAEMPEAEWMTFDPVTGYVIDIGFGAPALHEYSPERRHDVKGRRVLPGIHDSHIHVSNLGHALCSLQLRNCKTLDEFALRLGEYCKTNKSPWVIAIFDELDCDLSRAELDAICREKPLVLYHTQMHWLVLNSKGLEITGISESTNCPAGGVIGRYPDGHQMSGQLSGVLKDVAMKLIADHADLGSEAHKTHIKTALDYCLKQGITSVHTNEGVWHEYCHLAEEQQLPIRVFYAGYYSRRHKGNFPAYAGESRGEFLSCDRVKLFTDGALGCDTAALSEPYIGTCNHGILLYSQEEFDSEVHEATSRGFRLEIHMIGDAAADLALKALQKANVAPEKRPILTHCQILRHEHLAMMKERGVIANIQPQFVVSDTNWLHKRVPETLTAHAYAWKTIMNAGVTCAGGSDAPAEEPKPLLGIYDAIFRQMQTRDTGSKIFRPDECLTIDEALTLYTRNGAYTTCRERDLGQLRPGFQADFIILDSPRDIRDDPASLLQAQVDQVYIAGHKRFDRKQ